MEEIEFQPLCCTVSERSFRLTIRTVESNPQTWESGWLSFREILKWDVYVENSMLRIILNSKETMEEVIVSFLFFCLNII